MPIHAPAYYTKPLDYPHLADRRYSAFAGHLRVLLGLSTSEENNMVACPKTKHTLDRTKSAEEIQGEVDFCQR